MKALCNSCVHFDVFESRSISWFRWPLCPGAFPLYKYVSNFFKVPIVKNPIHINLPKALCFVSASNLKLRLLLYTRILCIWGIGCDAENIYWCLNGMQFSRKMRRQFGVSFLPRSSHCLRCTVVVWLVNSIVSPIFIDRQLGRRNSQILIVNVSF